MEFAAALRRVRDTAPLVQCITNFVTVNDCANIILAAGGSPSMADDIREAAESAAGADALVCNLGAIGKVDSMISAGQSANRAGHPVVLDPVSYTHLQRPVGIVELVALLGDGEGEHLQTRIGEDLPEAGHGRLVGAVGLDALGDAADDLPAGGGVGVEGHGDAEVVEGRCV